MVYITIHRPDAIPRLLQLGADLVHGVVKGAGQAVEGFARLGLAELGRGTKGVVQQDADSHAGDHSLEESTRFHRVHLFFIAFLSFIGLCTVCPAEVKKCEKDGGVSCQAGAELV